MVIACVTGIGAVYFVLLVVGLLPSVVYRISAPAVSQDSTTSVPEVTVPAAGVATGVAVWTGATLFLAGRGPWW